MFINNDIFKDNRLSLKAIGLLAVILATEDNATSEDAISTRVNDNLTSIRSAFKTLQELGYISRSQTRDNKGRFYRADIKILK